MSASSRAGTRAIPSSWTWTGNCSRAETSRSVVARVSSAPVAFISTPVRAGMPGRDDTARWTVWSASDRTSRSHLNFTEHLPVYEPLVEDFKLVVVVAVETGISERSCSVAPGYDSRTRWRTAPGVDLLRQLLDLSVDAASRRHEGLDLLDPVEGRGVVALEHLPDLDEREAGQLAEEVHRDVAGRRQRAGPALRDEVGFGEAEVGRGLLEDRG